MRGLGVDLTRYRHADCADNSNDGRSVSGTVITQGGVAVSWASIMQSCGRLSRAEAEYVALGKGVKEAQLPGAVQSLICPKLRGSCIRVFRITRGA